MTLDDDEALPQDEPKTERRRKTDGINITLDDVWTLLKDVNDRVSSMEHRHSRVITAFVRNDLDLPDYEGHRRAHIEMIETAKLLRTYKTDATKRIINGAISFILGLVAMGLFEWIKRGGGLA